LTSFLHLAWLIVMVLAMASLFVWVLLPPVHAVTFYKWVDKNGVLNVTDDLEKVPPEYRNQMEREVEEDISSAQSPTSSQSPAQSSEEVKEARKDIYGRDETWWREKARVWHEKLRDATAKLETVNNKIIEESEAISRKYWSPTQYKMNMVELDRLKEEKSKYQAQVDEAKERLKRLSKEAEDMKADPQWIK
jgi:FtsZ-binding cell division protein ZapB